MYSQIVITLKGLLLLYGASRGFAFLLNREEAGWIRKAPTVLLVGMFAIGMWGYSVWVAFAALVLMIGLLPKNRADAAALYAVAIVSLPVLKINVVVGSVFLLAVDKWLICAVGLALAFFKNGPDPQTQKLTSRFDVPFLLLLGLALEGVRDQNMTSVLRTLSDISLTLLLPYMLISRSLTRVEHIKRFIVSFAFSGFAMAFIAFMETRLHTVLYGSMYSGLHVSQDYNPYMKTRGGIIRAPASFFEATSLGLYLSMAFIAILALRPSFASTPKWAGALTMLILGVLAANSRNAFLGIGVGMVAFDFYRRHYSAAAIKCSLAGIGYLILQVLAQISPYFASLAGNTDATRATLDYRNQLLTRGIEEIRKHPYLGTTIAKALDNLQDMRQGEGIIDIVNGYIYYGLIAGVFGVVALLMVFVALSGAMWLARRSFKLNAQAEAGGAFVFAVAAASILSTIYTGFGGHNSTPFYEVAALGAALWAIRANVRAIAGAARTGDGAPIVPVPVPHRSVAQRRAAAIARRRPPAAS